MKLPRVGTVSPSAGELAERIAAQRSLVDALRPCAGDRCGELLAGEETLEQLEDEFRRLVPEPPPIHHSPMDAARQLADVLQFKVAASHRKNLLGRVVTSAKRLLVEGLSPVHVELLRPQSAFNQEVLGVLEQLRGRASGAQGGGDWSAWVSRRLSTLNSPAAFRPNSHRASVVGRAVTLAKTVSLRAVSPSVRPVFEAQRHFNDELIAALALFARGNPVSGEQTGSAMERLESLADPVSASIAAPTTRLLAPLWREVWRRQTRFNREVLLCAADLLGARTPPPVDFPAYDYARWIREVEPGVVAEVTRRANTLALPPLHAILPLHGRSVAELKAALGAIAAQTLRSFRVTLVRPRAAAPAIEKLLSAVRADARFSVHTADDAAVGVNEVAHDSDAELFVLLDARAPIAPHALAAVAVHLRDHEADVLYGDEDWLVDGRRVRPFFKPGFSIDLLRSTPYLGLALAVRREAFREAGGLRGEHAKAFGYDLALRLAGRNKRFERIPTVLSHRAEDSADDLDAASRALAEHLDLCEPGARIERAADGFHVRYGRSGEPLVSIIVPFKDRPELLEQLTATMKRTRYANYELLLVSNNSVDPRTFELLDQLTDPRIKKLRWDHPFNYPAINNWAARQAKGELLLFLNNDMEIVDPAWLDELVSQSLRPGVAAVCPKLLFPDGSVQHAGVVVGFTGFAGHPFWRLPNRAERTPFGHADWTRNYLAVTSACVAMQATLFWSLDGYDERFRVCGSDVDLCLRAVQRGLRIVYAAGTHLIHHESASRRVDALPEGDYWRSFSSYRSYLVNGDPLYHPQLTLQSTSCDFRFEGEDGEQLALNTLRAMVRSKGEAGKRTRAAQVRHIADHLPMFDLPDVGKREGCAPLEGHALNSVALWASLDDLERAELRSLTLVLEELHRRYRTRIELVVWSGAPETLSRAAQSQLPFVRGVTVVGSFADIEALPGFDLSIATDWLTAYLVAAHRSAKARAYFVRDFEPAQFAAGTFFGLSERAFRLGLFGIFQSESVGRLVSSEYGMAGHVLSPLARKAEPGGAARTSSRGRALKIVFDRDRSRRDGPFELGLLALERLRQLNVSAFEEVDPGGDADVVLEVTGGLVPASSTLDAMAHGAAVVATRNEATEWLFKHEETALVSDPTVSCLAAALGRLLVEPDLRSRLSERGCLLASAADAGNEAEQLLRALRGSDGMGMGSKAAASASGRERR